MSRIAGDDVRRGDIFRRTVVVVMTLAVLFLLWQFRAVVVLFLLSLALAASIRPLIDYWVERNGLLSVALAVTYVLLVGVMAGLPAVVGGPLLGDLQQITDDVANAYERAQVQWPESDQVLQRIVGNLLPPAGELYGTLTGERGVSVARTLLGVAAGLLGFAGEFAIVVILSLYWNADRLRFERLWLSLLTPDSRLWAGHVWREIQNDVGTYIRVKVLRGVLAGLVLWLGYRLLGLDYAVLLALTGAVMQLVPWLGPVLTPIPPLLAGMKDGAAQGLAAGAYALLTVVLLGRIVRSRVPTHVSYSSFLLLVVVAILADTSGLAGAILAAPLAIAVQLVLVHWVRLPTQETVPRRADEMDRLRACVADLKSQLQDKEGPIGPEVANLVERCAELAEQTSALFEAQSEGGAGR